MVTAIVLVKADIQRIPEVAEMIAQIAEVSEVYSVTGEFDLVAMIRVRGHDELADVIPGRLNKVPGVTHTETHIAFRAYSRHDLEAAFSLGASGAGLGVTSATPHYGQTFRGRHTAQNSAHRRPGGACSRSRPAIGAAGTAGLRAGARPPSGG